MCARACPFPPPQAAALIDGGTLLRAPADFAWGAHAARLALNGAAYSLHLRLSLRLSLSLSLSLSLGLSLTRSLTLALSLTRYASAADLARAIVAQVT